MAKNQENIFDECARAIQVIIQLSKIDGVRRPTAIKIFKDRTDALRPDAIANPLKAVLSRDSA